MTVLFCSSTLKPDFASDLALPTVTLNPFDDSYEQRNRDLNRCYHSTGDSLYLYQLGHLSLEAGDLAQARMYFLAERQSLQPGEHLRLANNAFEMGRLAQLRGELCQSMLYIRASLRYARLAQNQVLEKRSVQLLNQLMLLLGERPL